MRLKILVSNTDQLRNICFELMANPIGLIVPSVGVSAAIVASLINLLQYEIYDGWVALTFLISTCTVAALIAWVTAPLWGLFYLKRIESKFGVKTREKVWDWFSPQCDSLEDNLDIEEYARQVGELTDDKVENCIQPSKCALTDDLAYSDIMGASSELKEHFQRTVNKFNLTETQFIEACKIASNGVIPDCRDHGSDS